MSSTTTSGLYLYLRTLLEKQEGQDLVEYALVTSLIGFGAVAGMQNLATSIDTIFDAVTIVLSSNIT